MLQIFRKKRDSQQKQIWSIEPKNNLQATHQSPPMPLAARHSFSKGSKSRAQYTSQCVQIMFKAEYIYKNYAFSRFDHKTMRKKTHQNELDGWKHDGWALASG